MTGVSTAKCPITRQNFTGSDGREIMGIWGFTAAVGDNNSGNGGDTQRDRLLHSAVSKYAREAEIAFSERGNKGEGMFHRV